MDSISVGNGQQNVGYNIFDGDANTENDKNVDEEGNNSMDTSWTGNNIKPTKGVQVSSELGNVRKKPKTGSMSSERGGKPSATVTMDNQRPRQKRTEVDYPSILNAR
ncbi:hypothetical protein HDU76_010118, partial [Blyttiomyces sp. JEL0837]